MLAQPTNSRTRSFVAVTLAALGIGVVNALVLEGFEFLVNDGTQYLWNDLLHTDTWRWVVVPLAAVLSLGVSFVFRLAGQQRIGSAHTDPLAGAEETTAKTSLSSIGLALLIGLACLLAGASLGPEAPLVAFATSIGLWVALRARVASPLRQVLVVSSVGALLVAFLGSMVMVLVPLLLLIKQKTLDLRATGLVAIAGLASYVTLLVVEHDVSGWGRVPVQSQWSWSDIFLAVGVGVIGALVGWALKQGVSMLSGVTAYMDTRLHWTIAGLGFGAVLGIAYLFGGPSSEFNGSAGSTELLHHVPSYSTGALVVILCAKLFATAWSLAAGYKGGLVFPSIYASVVVFLIVQSIAGAAGPGVLVGSIAGVLSAMTGPVVGVIFVAAILPLKLLPVALLGVLGAMIGNRLARSLPSYPAK